MISDTLQVIIWAKSEAQKNEVVREFWDALCDAVNEKNDASPDKIYSEIRLYGSNTLLRSKRPEGVNYHEVAADVADKLAGWAFWQKSPYGYDTIDDCERFVLEKMEISPEHMADLCKAVSKQANEEAVINAVGNGAKDYAIAAGTSVAAALVVRQLAIQTARQVILQIARSLNIFLAILVIIDIAGPAYRCTIPAVVYMALLRKMHFAAQKGLC